MLNIYSNRRAFSSANGHSTVLVPLPPLPPILIQFHTFAWHTGCMLFVPCSIFGSSAVFQNSCAPVLPPLRLQTTKPGLDYSNTVGKSASCYFVNFAANDTASKILYPNLPVLRLRYPFHSPSHPPPRSCTSPSP